MNTKRTYTQLTTEKLALTLESKILAGSIISANTSIIIPMGQPVDTYDFSSPDFSHEWDVTPGSN